MKDKILANCQAILPDWKGLTINDFDFDSPKGFSSFTMGIRSKKKVRPPAILYRQLEGKENAILDFNTEKEVFLFLGENNIAAHCHDYNDAYRIEEFYQGRTLMAHELFEEENLRKIASELFKFHQLSPQNFTNRELISTGAQAMGENGKESVERSYRSFPKK